MKSSRTGFKISTTILVLIFVVVSIISSSTLLLQYYFAKQLAQDATQHNTEFLVDKTCSQINEIESTSFDALSLLELSSHIEKRPQPKIEHPMLRKFVLTMKNKTYIYAMYSGYDTGEFYEVINLNIDEKLRVKYNATKEERWLVIKIFEENGTNVNYEEYLDENLNILRSIRTKSNYNPTKRPWYIKAIKSKDMIKNKSLYV